jgi:hypothetical protein
MIYLVKNQSGAESQVTEKMYNYCKGKKEYQCRTIGGEPLKAVEPTETNVSDGEWPKKDENSSWYTLSNGRRIQGEEKALKAQSEL